MLQKFSRRRERSARKIFGGSSRDVREIVRGCAPDSPTRTGRPSLANIRRGFADDFSAMRWQGEKRLARAPRPLSLSPNFSACSFEEPFS
jgi:hypothetical protein